MLLDPNKYPPLDWRKLTAEPLADVHWNTQWSGIEVPDELYEPWKRHVTKVLGILPASLKDDEDDFDEGDFPEGRIYYRLHRQRERNSKLVEQAKARTKQKGRLYCWACSFDFAAVYGAYGEGFVEAHHTVPVHQLAENSKTKIRDLAMVCCNCHRILHRHPSLTVEKLRRWLSKNR